MVEVYLEDGGSVFLRDIGTHLPHYNSTLGHNPKIHDMNIYSREHLILSIWDHLSRWRVSSRKSKVLEIEVTAMKLSAVQWVCLVGVTGDRFQWCSILRVSDNGSTKYISCSCHRESFCWNVFSLWGDKGIDIRTVRFCRWTTQTVKMYKTLNSKPTGGRNTYCPFNRWLIALSFNAASPTKRLM